VATRQAGASHGSSARPLRTVGQPVSVYNPELIKRYTIGKDGVGYGANVFEKTRAAAMEARARAAAEPDTPSKQALVDLQKAIGAAGGTYWLAELTVPAS